MRTLARVSVIAALVAAFAVAPAVASAHSDHRSPVVGYVYVNDNTAPANAVAGFARHLDGTLTALPGSPFATGGAGTASGLASQGALQSADHGRYLLAVDGGSNQISVLRVHRDGRLALVRSGPVSSDGAKPVSIAVHDHLVYVANAGAGGSDYTGFALTRHGRLVALPGTTFPLLDSATPGDVLFNGDGTRLVGTRVGTDQIDSFVVGSGGRLTAAPGSPYAAQGPGPFGSEFSPTDPSALYVSNAHGGTAAGTVSAFRDGSAGALSSIGSSPFPDGQTAPCWVEISHNGRFLFTVNTGQPSISRYAIGGDGSLALLGSTGFKDPTGLAPVDARLSPAGDTLWVVGGGGKVVSAFAVRGGDLTELPSSPTALPADSAPSGIVVL
ncbi:MAG TPA: beta-propeller fold lactonase family protein [Solirubrobacteraceae bacterium]|jgi:6-phosphogluconolactonase (cycloisomerase 2 family)